ncbi:MAG TPA: hypothetical protein VGT24_02235 [Candidatus Acidoferrales bacterium]|nr:hypothetical protein [Candidatus Acidoferrales bacterium]
MRRGVLVVWLLLNATAAGAQTWTPLGPPGGDVRVLASDPSRPGRIFLGTADGHIFGSEDSGAHWTILGRAGTRLDAVITAIVVDPRDGNHLFASSWTRDPAAGGGVFQSRDGGRTWRSAGLEGEPVRALALAPSNPDILVAGTLDGIYLSHDSSKTWERISPEHHAELRNLDSLAFDPADSQIIYAGTFHLPWKTADGGRSWRPIHDGMIDDSDVMSLLVDAGDPRRIFASACSGIYRSDDGAAQWRKIQGIPYAARRTYAITQSPEQPASVYAATSEGLWKTPDGGMTWRRMTPESWVVNTVVVSRGRAGRILIGTEELGVLASDDGGEHFQDANEGFDHRQILALGLDARHPARVLAVLAHAPEPILATGDDGRSWSPMGPGIRAEQALRVYAAPDETWWASLAGGGLMRYDAAGKMWKRAGALIGDAFRGDALAAPKERRIKGRMVRDTRPLQEIVTDMAFASTQWFAATGAGLLVSEDLGATWTLRRVGPLTALPVQSVRVSPDGRRIRVVSLRGLVFSDDGGETWSWHDLPLSSGGAVRLEADPADENTLIAMARDGLYISRDAGSTWQQAGSGLPGTPVQDFAATGGVFVASMRTGGLFVSSDAGRNWDRVPGTLAEGFFAAVIPGNRPGSIFAASATEGLYSVEWSVTAASGADSAGRARELALREKRNPGNE